MSSSRGRGVDEGPGLGEQGVGGLAHGRDDDDDGLVGGAVDHAAGDLPQALEVGHAAAAEFHDHGIG
jgi:hypothetical protein